MRNIIERTEEENKKLITATINNLKSSSVYDVRLLGDKLRNYKNGFKSKPIMRPISLYSDCVDMLELNSAFYNKKEYDSIISYAEQVYKDVFPFAENTPDFNERAMIFLAMFEENGVIRRHCFDGIFFNLFNDGSNFIKWVKSLSDTKDILQLRQYYLPYAVAARSYFPDEDMFTANIISVTGRLMASPVPDQVVAEELKKIEHMIGIYNVDESLVLRAEQNIQAAKDTVDRSKNILETIEEKIKIINDLSESTVSRVKSLCENEVRETNAKLDSIDARLKKEYDNFVESQKTSLSFDKNAFIDDVTIGAQAQLSELKKTAQMIVSSAKLELTKINRESGDAITKLDSYIKNDDKFKQLMDNATEKNDIMEKLEKLMILNDKNIEAMSKTFENAASPTPVAAPATATVIGAPQVIIPGDVAPIDDSEPIPEINPLLDDSVNFRDRFNHVMEAKKKMEAQGAHFHQMFDDVVMAVMENANPYLIGPSGCGKTFMVGQLAKLLNVEFIDIGYINEEYDILGFQTANGGYSKPNFYRCYKYGKIAFCDELDNGNSRATVKLNAFLSNTSHGSYNFPNGERVQRHNNFRIIGAGNTAGNGADNIYNTRERIEESVQQRFTPIYIGYDNKVERAILGKYNAWYEFVVAFRNATNAWSRSSHSEAPGIITTRDVTRIKKYIDNGSFNLDKILDYEFIQTKDETYLAFLAQQIQAGIKVGNPAEAIAKRFVQKVDDIRRGVVIR